jgi:glycerol-3-phosphate O-acyltransferase
MPPSVLHRVVASALRRILYLWVRSETINPGAGSSLDRSRPVIYVLESPAATDLAVVDQECRRLGLPRPVRPVALGPVLEPRAHFYLTPAADWLTAGP